MVSPTQAGYVFAQSTVIEVMPSDTGAYKVAVTGVIEWATSPDQSGLWLLFGVAARTKMERVNDQSQFVAQPCVDVRCLIAVLVLGVSVYGQDRYRDDYRGEWVYLGNRHVDGHRDRDVVQVGVRDGKFRAVQLRVSGGAVDFHRVIVHFGNGTSEEIAFRERIPDGSRTRPIDLPGDRRVISRVEMWYGKESWHRLPKVEVYGIR
jgi:hypothetical protein